jgi:hypothetical protein
MDIAGARPLPSLPSLHPPAPVFPFLFILFICLSIRRVLIRYGTAIDRRFDLINQIVRSAERRNGERIAVFAAI